jgi:hypothetical protein
MQVLQEMVDLLGAAVEVVVQVRLARPDSALQAVQRLVLAELEQLGALV